MAIKPLNGKMVLPRQLTPLVAPPTAPRAKNLGMIFKKSIANSQSDKPIRLYKASATYVAVK